MGRPLGDVDKASRNNSQKILIASRKSELARIQALAVAAELKAKNPSLNVDHYFRPSLGDLNQSDPLWKMPEKGVFTQDFRQGLIDGEFDMVVHSWKDLPIEPLEGTEIVATLPRADMRDMFFMKKNRWDVVQAEKRLTVLTSSPRRMYNLEPFFKSYLPTPIERVDFEDVRGNVQTRIQKLRENPNVDGLVLAKAAWDRLMVAPEDEFKGLQTQLGEWLQEFQWMLLPLRLNPCAAAQGGLAVEVANGRDDLKALLSTIHCEKTWNTVHRERDFLKSHGGGCHQKIGASVLPRPYGDITFSKGLTEAGLVLDSSTLEGLADNPFTKEESFPTDVGQSAWFDRQELPYEGPAPEGHHFVARENALPKNHGLTLEHCVWTAGLKTWRALAQRGVWVSGSTESLGEQEDFRLEALLPGDQTWWKWTHEDGAVSDKFKAIATYKLTAKAKTPDVSQKKNFYWMSGSSFQSAVAKSPSIVAANHYCGPGQTFSAILSILENFENSGPLTVVMGYDQWAECTWKGTS